MSIPNIIKIHRQFQETLVQCRLYFFEGSFILTFKTQGQIVYNSYPATATVAKWSKRRVINNAKLVV